MLKTQLPQILSGFRKEDLDLQRSWSYLERYMDLCTHHATDYSQTIFWYNLTVGFISFSRVFYPRRTHSKKHIGKEMLVNFSQEILVDFKCVHVHVYSRSQEKRGSIGCVCVFDREKRNKELLTSCLAYCQRHPMPMMWCLCPWVLTTQ